MQQRQFSKTGQNSCSESTSKEHKIGKMFSSLL